VFATLFRPLSMLGRCCLEYLIFIPYLIELMLSKIGKRVVEFVHFRSLAQSPFKVRKSCKRKERMLQRKSSKYVCLLFSL
jgi:hypothetical protein